MVHKSLDLEMEDLEAVEAPHLTRDETLAVAVIAVVVGIAVGAAIAT